MYSMVYFFARRRTRTPGKNKTIVAILQFYPQSHSEYYAPLKTFLLYSVPFRFRPPPLLYLPLSLPFQAPATQVPQFDSGNFSLILNADKSSLHRLELKDNEAHKVISSVCKRN